jgi:asparagine synthase (glutamine-hydrolysing)
MDTFASLSDLEKELYAQMVKSIEGTLESIRTGISFSGGVDSSLLGKITKDLGYDTLLLTMGFKGSHDIEFSKIMAEKLGIPHEIEVISEETFPKVAKKIWETLNVDNLSWNENCIAFYYVSQLAKKHGITKVITANGIDELFCGYNSYRDFFPNGGKAVHGLMEEKIGNEIQMMKAVNQITSWFGIQFLQPFLSDKFIDYSKTIPLEHKIKDNDDLIRKHIVRKLALSVGVPQESALKQKKAMQYGSLIHKNFLKVKKTWNMNF